MLSTLVASDFNRRYDCSARVPLVVCDTSRPKEDSCEIDKTVGAYFTTEEVPTTTQHHKGEEEPDDSKGPSFTPGEGATYTG